MPYEDDYKRWLEKMFIEMNPDWICDGMHDTEFTHDWCYKYCGKDDLYITPKCLHMYYHHIVRADRKTESNSEKPNNCEDKPQTCYTCEYEWRDGTDEPCVYCYGGSKYKSKDEPQKHCHRPSNVACHPEQGNMWCRGCDYWYADEPQTEREGE